MLEFKPVTLIRQEFLRQILIDAESVTQSQIDPLSLVCSICHHIVWNPVMCSIKNGCHTYFCTSCINSWITSFNSKAQANDKTRDIPCPNCKQKLISSSPPPVLKCLLNKLKVKCLFSRHGCQQVVKYSSVQEHAVKQCGYREMKCQGCDKIVLYKEVQAHSVSCQLFIVECVRCNEQMSKRHYMKNHAAETVVQLKKQLTEEQTDKQINQPKGQVDKLVKENKQETQRTVECYSYEIENYHRSIDKLQIRVNSLNQTYKLLQSLTNKLIKGKPIPLQINFQTGFTQYFNFPSPTLIKSSYNPYKHRNDFLHFYISTPIHLNCLVPIQWTLTIQQMKGNLLIGFCSSIGGDSIDLIVNKYGQIKKKEQGENKYRLVRRVQGFLFAQRDVIQFRYQGRKNKTLMITNKTQKVSVELGKDCLDMFSQANSTVKSSTNQSIYPFYSMDTLGDQLSFVTN